MAGVKVSPDEIEKLKKQAVKPNGPVDDIDAFDRGFGRIFSKLGKIVEDVFINNKY